MCIFISFFFASRCTIACLCISEIRRMGRGEPHGFGGLVVPGSVPSVHITHEVSDSSIQLLPHTYTWSYYIVNQQRMFTLHMWMFNLDFGPEWKMQIAFPEIVHSALVCSQHKSPGSESVSSFDLIEGPCQNSPLFI